MSAVVLERVTKLFGGLAAVRDVNLNIPYGERRALLGLNGAGKTTLFNLVAGDLRVSHGRVVLFDEDVTGLAAHRRAKFGLRRTYQTSALFDDLSVAENLYLSVLGPGGRNHFDILNSFSRDTARRERAAEVASSVGLSEQMERSAGDLSHGERRQLEIGFALAWEPRLVMLDEPAAGLSAEERQVVVGLMNELNTDTTLLLIEHDMDVALAIGERVTVMHEGAILAEGTPDEISSNVQVQEVYLGERA